MRLRKGFTLIELMIVIAIIAIIAAVAIPNLLRARRTANEASAISSLRTMVSAQAMYLQDFSQYCAALSTMSLEGLIDDVLGTGTKSGYIFDLSVPTGLQQSQWLSTARPISVGSTGQRRFYTDQTGVIRFSSTAAAGATSAAID